MAERIGRLFLPWIGILAARLAGLNKTVTVVGLTRWLALRDGVSALLLQDDIPIPPRMKWGTWRLDMEDLDRVVSFLAEKPGGRG